METLALKRSHSRPRGRHPAISTLEAILRTLGDASDEIKLAADDTIFIALPPYDRRLE
jgi:hypothetical protein